MNLNFKNSKKLGMLLGVILFTVLAVGVTYAVIVWRTTDYNVTLNSKCLVQGNFTKGSNISGADLLLLDTSSDESNKITIKNGMTLSNFSVWKDTTSDCTIDGYLRIVLNVTNIPTAYTTSGNSTNALKYALFYYDPNTYPTVTTSNLNNQVFTTLTKGSITQNGTMDIYYDTLLNNGNSKNYILAIYLDGSLVSNDASDSNFTASVEASIEQVNKNTPTVTFDPNGGTVNTTSKVVKYGESYGDLPIPTRAGYTFLGWNGKNKFNEEEILMAIEGATYENGYYVFYNTSAYNKYNKIGLPISLKDNTQYTYTVNGYVDDDYFVIASKYDDETITYFHLSDTEERTRIVTTAPNKNLRRISFSYYSARSTVYITHIQIEEGTEATAYEPYYITRDTTVVQGADHTLTAIWEEDSE